MSLKPYMKYKNTGLAWIGEIPDEWKLEPISKWFQERRATVSEEDYPALSVTKQGVVPQLSDIAFSDDTANRRFVMKGDFVINSRSDRKGSSGVAPRDGSVSLINTVLASRGLDPSYTQYLLKSQPFQEEFYRWGHGIVADLWSTNWSDMKSIKIPVPDSDTQTCIARYLDRETAEIDAFIGESERLIELLNERRTAAITQAVTKGLNPDAPMKDSGIEWLGQVPEHWEITKLRYVANINPPVPEFQAYPDDETVLFLPLETIWPDGKIDLSRKVSLATVRNGYVRFQKEDILVPKVTPTFQAGRVAIIPEIEPHFGAASTENHVVRALENTSNRFLHYVLRTVPFLQLGEASFQGVAGLQRVPTEFLAGFKFAICDMREQESIADYLDESIQKIDDSIATAREAIALARERRQALISAAVTGKIDVRSAQ